MKSIINDGRLRTGPKLLPGLLALVAIAAGLGGVWLGTQEIFLSSPNRAILLYTSIVLGIGGLTYLSLSSQLDESVTKIELNSRQVKIIDIGLLLISSVLAVTVWSYSEGLPDWFFALALVATGLICIRIAYRPNLRALFEILLFAVVLRANLWYAAPFIGKDGIRHMFQSGYIAATGQNVPPSFTYHADFPVAHILTASTKMITDLPLEQTYFLTLGIAGIGSTVAVYIFTVHLLGPKAKVGALYAVLFVLLSVKHINYGSIIRTQILSVSLLSFALLLIIMLWRTQDARLGVLTLVSILAMVKTHNLAPFLLTGMLFLWILAVIIRQQLRLKDAVNSRSVYLGVVILWVSVLFLTQWMGANYLKNQINRIVGILIGNTDVSRAIQKRTSGETAGTTGTSDMATTDILLELDPLLRMSGDILLHAFFMVLIGLLFVEFLCQRSGWDWRDELLNDWLLVVIMMYFLFTVGFLFSSATFTRRALASVSVIMAPAVGFVCWTIIRRRSTGGVVLVTTLLITGAFFGLTHPSNAITERTVGYESYVQEETVESFNFMESYRTSFHADEFYYSRYLYVQLGEGQALTKNIALRNGELDLIFRFNMYKHQQPDEPYMYRSYLKEYKGQTVPDTFEVLYSVGKAKLVRPAS